MTISMFRPPGPRVFPDPNHDWFPVGADESGLSADQRAARQLLGLAAGLWAPQRCLGLGLSRVGRVRRLLYLHRQAFLAEREGRWRRADFFWDHFRGQFARLPAGHPVWANLGARLAAEGAIELGAPGALRPRLVREVFLDAHIAFLNGHAARLGANADRALAHQTAAERLLPEAGLGAAEQRRLLAGPSQVQIAEQLACGQSKEAAESAALLLRRFPDDPTAVQGAAEVLIQTVRGRLSDGTNPQRCRVDADLIQREIEETEHLRQIHPYTPALYELLARLCQLRATRLYAGKRTAEALMAVEQALAYWPEWADGIRIRDQLRGCMEDLIRWADDIDSRLDRQVRARHPLGGKQAERMREELLRELGDEDRLMWLDVQRGYRLRDAFLATSTPKTWAEDRARARARTLWELIGLPRPPDRWHERAAALDQATDHLQARLRLKPGDLRAAWTDVVAAHPSLQVDNLDAEAICVYFARLPAGADKLAAPSVPLALPCTLETAPSARRDRLPFDFWLLSKRDAGLKGVLAAAAVMLLAAGGLSVHESRERSRRDAAYEDLTAAVAQRNPEDVRAAAGRFAAAPSLIGEDPRGDHVRTALQEAEEMPGRARRDEAYARLHRAAELGDDLASLRAAEDFLAAPPIAGTDPRQGQVRQIYQRAFVRWFAAHPGLENAEGQERVRRYQELLVAKGREEP